MKRCVGDENGIGIGRNTSDHVVERCAKTNVRGVFVRECRAGHGEGIDEIDIETSGAKNGCGLYCADVGEVGIVDEVARDANRREDDRDAGHRGSVGESGRGGKEGPIDVTRRSVRNEGGCLSVSTRYRHSHDNDVDTSILVYYLFLIPPSVVRIPFLFPNIDSGNAEPEGFFVLGV